MGPLNAELDQERSIARGVELKAKMGGSDHTLLETAEQGEDAAKKAYEEVLKMNDVPAPIQSVLRKQQTHILQSPDRVKAVRDATAA